MLEGHSTELLIIVFLLVLVIILLLRNLKKGRSLFSMANDLARAADKKQAMDQTLSLLMEHSSDFVFRYDGHGNIIYVSNNVERVLGYEISEGPRHFTDVLTDNPLNKTRSNHIKEVFIEKNFKESPFFVEVFDADSKPQMLEVYETPFQNDAGDVLYVTCIAKNVTDIYNVELELKESERQQNLILQSLPDALFMIDHEYRYLDYQNPAGANLWYNPKDFIGKKITEVIPEPLGSRLQKAVAKAFDSDEPTRVEYTFGSDDEMFYEGRMIKLSDERLLIISRDITAQKKLESGLLKAKAAAEAATAAKSNFLATMSHEIRTPMNGVIGMTGLLAQTELSAEQKDYVETIQASGDSLLRVINDILDYSKIESGKMSFEETLFSLEKVLDDSINLVVFEATKKGIVIEKQMEDDVPKFINSDRGRLRQILLNLLSNAVKFTESGMVKLSVKLESKTKDSCHLKFSIMDTGIGIPQEKLDSLFKEFTQADSSHSRKYGGTGLGLAIVKNLVKLFGGKVKVQSKVGKGSTFKFTIHAKLGSKQTTSSNGGNQSTFTPISDKYPLEVLLAEDNSVNRKLTSLFLEKLGYHNEYAIDGLEVIQLLKQKPYDLLLLDISMPNMDGYEVTKLIKEMDLENPPYIIGVSANAFKSDIDKALNAGMDDYITKPVKFEELKEKLIKAGSSRLSLES